MPMKTRRPPQQQQITLVFNMEEQDENTNLPSPTRIQVKKKTIQPPQKKRGRKKMILPTFTGKLESLADLIALAEEEVLYVNIDVQRIIAIKEELMELHAMIGLFELKQSVFEQLVFYLQHLHEGSEMYMNTVIYGPPGTGKTTIAKLLGHMFSKLKVIRIPDGYEYEYDEDDPNVEEIFEVARRDDLIGEYLGHTATKTHAFLEMCLGGVVFIDEVYSLGNKDKNDSFSKEAIDTINLFLSENRDHFMMIIAGYKEEIDTCFFTYNEGLRRRFMWYHTIEPYTPEQLRDIFLLKVLQTDWAYDETVPDTVLHVIRQYKDVFPDHAGSIENFITLVKIKHGTRVILLPEHHKKRLTTEDIISAIVSTQKKSKQESFMSMYM